MHASSRLESTVDDVRHYYPVSSGLWRLTFMMLYFVKCIGESYVLILIRKSAWYFSFFKTYI